MARRRVTRKEMSQPDEFVSFWQRAYLAYAENPRQSLIRIGAGVLVAALVIGLGIWLRTSKTSLRDDFNVAVAELESVANPAEATALAGRFAALRGRATLSHLRPLALYYQAASLQRAGNFAQAKDLFAQFLAGHDKHDTLFFSASLALAKCEEASGARADAIRRIESLMDDAGNPLAPEYIFALAGIRETSGDPNGAGVLYKKLIDKHADAPQVAGARAKLEELGIPAGG